MDIDAALRRQPQVALVLNGNILRSVARYQALGPWRTNERVMAGVTPATGTAGRSLSRRRSEGPRYGTSFPAVSRDT
jgi:hypothetical protein